MDKYNGIRYMVKWNICLRLLVIPLLTMAASGTTIESVSGEASVPKDQARYDHYRIYNVQFDNEEQIKLFQKLEEESDSLTFIGHAREVGQKLSILVAAHRVADFADLLKTYNLVHRVLVSTSTLGQM